VLRRFFLTVVVLRGLHWTFFSLLGPRDTSGEGKSYLTAIGLAAPPSTPSRTAGALARNKRSTAERNGLSRRTVPSISSSERVTPRSTGSTSPARKHLSNPDKPFLTSSIPKNLSSLFPVPATSEHERRQGSGTTDSESAKEKSVKLRLRRQASCGDDDEGGAPPTVVRDGGDCSEIPVTRKSSDMDNLVDDQDEMIYLDNAATTRIHREVFEAMLEYMSSEYGNPHSHHGAHQRVFAHLQ